MLFYASSLYFVAPLARPDGLAVLFCMASITCLFDDVPPRAFLVRLLFALLALLTKVYRRSAVYRHMCFCSCRRSAG
jgi:hypothetical protein